MKKVINLTEPKSGTMYSSAIETGGMLFISGQLPIDPVTGVMAEGIEAQTAQAMENVKAILTKAGYTLDDVVRSTVLLDDITNIAAMNTIYAKYYTKDMPTRVCYQVVKLPMGAMVEIEAIAAH